MNYWLLKTEPHEFSFTDLIARGCAGEPWTGIRNYQARNFIRDVMAEGDGVIVYHSSCAQVGAVGIATICSDCFVDPLQFDPSSAYFDPKSTPEEPRWLAIQVRAVTAIVPKVTLSEIKLAGVFEGNSLIQRGNRLSVVPLNLAQWKYLCRLS